MPQAKSILAYEDVRFLMDKAMASPKGIRYEAETESRAKALASRAQMYRRLLRNHSKEIHDKLSPQYGVTDYDRLMISRNGKVLRIIKYENLVDPEKIENLEKDGDIF